MLRVIELREARSVVPALQQMESVGSPIYDVPAKLSAPKKLQGRDGKENGHEGMGTRLTTSESRYWLNFSNSATTRGEQKSLTGKLGSVTNFRRQDTEVNVPPYFVAFVRRFAMRKSFYPVATLVVLVSVLASAIPSAARSDCNCNNVQHVLVTCGACDTQIDTYPIQAKSNNSCTAYALTILYCCNDKNVPEDSSQSAGPCGGSSCPAGLTCDVKGKRAELPIVNGPVLQRR
jgi:hypothetical protein